MNLRFTQYILALFALLLFGNCSRKEEEAYYSDHKPAEETAAAAEYYKSQGLQLYTRLYFSGEKNYGDNSARIFQLNSLGNGLYFIAQTKAGDYSPRNIHGGRLRGPFLTLDSAVGITDNEKLDFLEWRFDERGTLWRCKYNSSAFNEFYPNLNGGHMLQMENLYTLEKSEFGYENGYGRCAAGKQLVFSLLRFNKPYLFQNVPDSGWRRTALDFVPQSSSDKALSFDVETFESDKVYLAWTSLDNKVQMAVLANGAWSAVSALPCSPTSNGTGLDGLCKVYLFKNNADPAQPYVVVHKGPTMDMFIWNGSSLQTYMTDVPAPIPVNYPLLQKNSAPYYSFELAFTGSHVYFLTLKEPTGNWPRRIFKLDAGSKAFNPLFATGDMTGVDVEAISGSKTGMYFSCNRMLNTGHVIRYVSDVVFVAD